MKIDVKKEERELYNPKTKPELINVKPMLYISVKGKGNPNDEDGDYKKALEKLYCVAYTIKMDKKNIFDYVIPPLEGFWSHIDYYDKSKLSWNSVIRIPIEITQDEFKAYLKVCENKKKKDFSDVELIKIDEGLCVQCMHIGSFDNEPSTINSMNEFITLNGYVSDINENRLHHEIYLSDPRRCKREALRTIIRLPIRKK